MTTTEKCAERGFAERPRFFVRQLITPDDLTLGQEYLRNKMRRHNRYLHGWGVVCGTRVDVPASKAAWMVVIRKGYILGPFGDEIVIEKDLCFDLRKTCSTPESSDPCGDSSPAGGVFPEQGRGGKWWVAVRYKELPSRPVRVQPVGCGCDDTQCEYSRWLDGYEVCTLDHCPETHANPPNLDQLSKPAGIPDCPACPTDPWVVLAAVQVDDKGQILSIDNCSCRRMVLSLAPYWVRCNEPPIVVSGTPAPADQPSPAPTPTPPPVPGRTPTTGPATPVITRGDIR